MMHRRLWRSGEIQGVDLGEYLADLRGGLIESWGDIWAEHLTLDAMPLVIPANRAVTLALVINEVLTNAAKYAYEGREGPITIALKEEGSDVICVVIADSDVGWRDDASHYGFGSRLTRSLMAQLDGDIEIVDNDPGTRVTLRAKRSA